MGRIKTTLVKRNTKKMMGIHGNRFGSDFNENKKVVSEVADIPSKKLRNVVAGYATRLSRKTTDQQQ